jgi:hypothetical protein
MSSLKVPSPDLQISFLHRLQDLRKTYLLDSLLEVVALSDIRRIDVQLHRMVDGRALKKTAGWGMRGEIIFAVPCVLEKRPFLLGYYRLLLGLSQKEFYGKAYGLASFKALEERGLIPDRLAAGLSELCNCLIKSGEILVRSVDRLDEKLVNELTILTLGPQLRGGTLNALGSHAVRKVFDLIKLHVKATVKKEINGAFHITNAAGRIVEICFAADPDIIIREKLPSEKYRNLVAIEIKGGSDRSNIHNRLGEAEKSHQKARKQGFVECWTIVRVAGLDMDLAKKESPSTDRFYNLDEISYKAHPSFMDFRENLKSRLGIKD